MRDTIYIKGAKEHNLKNIDVKIPRDKFVVLTGLSGSGKSSLAFDTIYAEGQRRYMESLSSYARQFLGQMEKPDVDSIEGLSPAISIDQKTTSKNPRSTVGTVTEIYDHLRLLYANVGIPHCHICGKEIKQQTVDQMVDAILHFEAGTKIMIMAPVIRGRKGEYHKLIEDVKKAGYVRVRVDGILYEVTDDIQLEKNKKHDIEVIIDRLIIKEGIRRRLTDSVEAALNMASGLLLVTKTRPKKGQEEKGQGLPEEKGERSLPGFPPEEEEILFSQNYACPDCGISMTDLVPRMFSFNNPFGACPTCTGLGSFLKIDPDLIIPDRSKSLTEGAVVVNGFKLGNEDAYVRIHFDALSKHYGFDLNTPFEDLPAKIQKILLYGNNGEKIRIEYERDSHSGSYMAAFEGIIHTCERRYRETQADSSKQYYEEFMSHTECPDCHGKRLRPESLAVTVAGKNIDDISRMSIADLHKWFQEIPLSEREQLIAYQILKEIRARVGFLVDVGLGYLTLSRAAATLSGGEAQRIRLATQIGSGLMGVLYILDEPSIGLHQRDNQKLLTTLKRMRDLGNTLIVVEHDEDTMQESDYIIDIGPGAGEHGGQVIAEGTYEEILQNPNSITGKYLSGAIRIEVPKERRVSDGRCISVRGAKENNLKNIDVDFPIGLFTCVTGVSGSGKSSLINEILYKALANKLNGSKTKPGKYVKIEGIEYLDKVINIDQSPIGRTPRSNPATYTGMFDLIREVFASTNEAKARGYKSGRFSFNVKGGRCESCSGDGIIKIEMHFLPDVYVPCEVCGGKRYNRETLEVKYKGKSISDVLGMTVEEAYEFFKNLPKIERKLRTLLDVGLGYVRVGQPSTQLSGGEAQRVKLATELSKRSTGKTLYILDEPTTGLHMADVHKLIEILKRLADGGNTVVVIEHNLDVIKTADHIIDIGPEGGDKGGKVLIAGTPEKVSQCKNSYTGEFLKKVLKK